MDSLELKHQLHYLHKPQQFLKINCKQESHRVINGIKAISFLSFKALKVFSKRKVIILHSLLFGVI